MKTQTGKTHNRLSSCVMLSFAIVYVLMLASCASFHGMERNTTDYGNNPDTVLYPRRQPGPQDCALTCIMTVFEYWGRHVSSREITEELGETPEDGYTLGQLRDFAGTRGFEAYVVRGDLSFLREHTALGRPVIAVLRQNNMNHSIVVTSIQKDGGIVAMDPAVGRSIRISQTDFLQKWGVLDNPALLLAPGPVQNPF